jgi:hypothetical protein
MKLERLHKILNYSLKELKKIRDVIIFTSSRTLNLEISYDLNEAKWYI